MANIVYESAPFKNGKKGIIRPDASGYYTVVFGAYGTENSVGWKYDIESARRLLAPGSIMQRLIEKKDLWAEMDHPEIAPYQFPNGKVNDTAWLQRVRSIKIDRRIAHIRKVYTKDMRDESGRPIMLVIGEIRPVPGVHGDGLRDALANPDANVCFSVRSLTRNDPMTGTKYTLELITWDLVNEPGISYAQKDYSPALESYLLCEITPTMLRKAARQQDPETAAAMEAAGQPSFESLIESLGWGEKGSIAVPVYMRWGK